MTPAQENAAKSCLHGAENNTMTFLKIVQTLMQEGFESYAIIFAETAQSTIFPMAKVSIPDPSFSQSCRQLRRERHPSGHPRCSAIGA